MGKGASPATQQTSAGLPEYVDPYFRRLLQGAEEATMPYYPDDPAYGDLAGTSTYQPYGGDRLTSSADYGDITASRDMIRNTAAAGIPGMTSAVAGQVAGMDGLAGLAGSPPHLVALQKALPLHIRDSKLALGVLLKIFKQVKLTRMQVFQNLNLLKEELKVTILMMLGSLVVMRFNNIWTHTCRALLTYKNVRQ